MTSTKWPPFCKRHFQTHDIKFHWSLLRVLKIQSKHLTNHTYHDKISHNAPFCTEMCTRMHIFVTKWCIVGSGTGALWDLWDSRVCSQRHGTKSYIEKKTSPCWRKIRHWLHWYPQTPTKISSTRLVRFSICGICFCPLDVHDETLLPV